MGKAVVDAGAGFPSGDLRGSTMVARRGHIFLLCLTKELREIACLS